MRREIGSSELLVNPRCVELYWLTMVDTKSDKAICLFNFNNIFSLASGKKNLSAQTTMTVNTVGYISLYVLRTRLACR